MRVRPFPALIIAALLAASCGQSRSPSELAGATDGSTAPGATSLTTPPALGPATTAADDEVAVSMVFGDGTEGEILHGEVNEVAAPTRANLEFVGLVYGPAGPEGLEALLTSQLVWTRVLDRELEAQGAAPTDDNLAEAKAAVLGQLTPLLATSADPDADSEQFYADVPYLPFLAQLQARQIALSEALAAGSPADSVPCVRHILVETQAEADAVVADLAGGADFGELARERSQDPGSGAFGGDLGCGPSDGYVPPFAAAVDGATVDEVVGPVESEFGFHVILVYRYGADTLVNQAMEATLTAMSVTVDERLGTWSPEQFQVLRPAG